MQAQMLAPAAVLVVWSLVMLFWMAGTRFPAMKAAAGNLANARPGGRGQDLEGVVPDRVNWKAHNYAHLMEQPTIFYPTVIILGHRRAVRVDLRRASHRPFGVAGDSEQGERPLPVLRSFDHRPDRPRAEGGMGDPFL